MSTVASQHLKTDGTLLRRPAWRLQSSHGEITSHRTHTPSSLGRSPIGLAKLCLYPEEAHNLVLIIAHERATRGALEKLCIQCDATAVAVPTVHEAEGIAARRGLAAFELVVLDTGVFGKSVGDQQRLTCRLLRAWTETHPGLPFVFIGTERQKHAILKIRADIVRVVTKPVSFDALADAMRMTLCGKRVIGPS